MGKIYSWSTLWIYPWTPTFYLDIFLYIENADLCNYADDGTLNTSEESLSIIIEIFKADS